ncbi:MAG: HAMP domain-containing histidine kinase [Clostridia bacterium]|nr:HAMP domain-containing histidine kinase [Clostridia bacterium]MBQ9506540.1 HAMP domain-containing histidine kinase [Clostridia bacterium]
MKANAKKWIVLYILAFLIPALLAAGAFLSVRAAYRAQSDRQLAALIGSLIEEYPELDEAEILALLQNERNAPEGEAFLEKYGYYGNMFYSAASGRFARAAFICVLAGSAGTFLCCGGVKLLHDRARRREIEDLTDYLKQIGRGADTLKIGENDEGELSKLRNEIYKLTVLLRETAAESEKHSRALSTSLADISHQIRTPLTAANVLLDNVAASPDMPAATWAEFISEARGRLRLISDLCVTLLQLSKFDSGTVELHPAQITARQVIDAALGNLSVLMDIRNVSPVCRGDLDAVFTADLRWQTEAITNILKNAVEHSPENSEILIEAENSGLFLSVRITDRGEGIDKEDLPHIFDRFYKAKNAGQDSFGVGLSLAKAVIEKDNGTLRAVSEKGKGSAFTASYRLV